MNSATILALPPGPELDQAIHTFLIGGTGPVEPYSTSDAAGAKILDRMGLFVGRVDSGPKYTPGKPWLAGVLAYEPTVSGYVTRLSVSAPTRLSALCKAALLVLFQPAKSDRVALVRPSEQAARELAARIGTPGARNPAAGVRAAQEAAAKRAADKAKRDEKAAKKAAKLAGKPYVPQPARAEAPTPPPAPHRAPTVPQPAVFTGERNRRAPMPTRPKEFVPPQPIDTGGSEKK